MHKGGKDLNEAKIRDERKEEEIPPTPYDDQQKLLKCFVLMPFGEDELIRRKDCQKENETEAFQERPALTKGRQDHLFRLLHFALNDAYYQNYINQIVRDWKPIQIERADTGAGRSPDLLDNVCLKIKDSDFCLADLSTENMNVALEIGYAYAYDKYIIKIQQDEYYHADTLMSDLGGKVRQPVNISRLLENSLWKKIAMMIDPELFNTNYKNFFYDNKSKLIPFGKVDEGGYHTFFAAWIKELSDIKVDDKELKGLETLYKEGIVKPLYPTIRPLWERQVSGGTETEYTCKVFASRKEANFSAAFASAKKRIRILTTNLQGLLEHVEDILWAVKKNPKIKIEILTLDPESEFVNARGTLIGKEIAEFRQEMKNSLNNCVDQLIKNGKAKNQVLIRIYREFPTQITYIIDENVYSSVVSVNHQSRHNIVFKIDKNKKGVENSFLQHWDTIWARAIDYKH
jgi:hypothetical protein